MERTSIPLQFEHDGITYSGWVTPSEQPHDDAFPKSCHVVLNNVFFGNLSFHDGHWLISEQRPADLTRAVGDALNEAFKKDPAAPADARDGVKEENNTHTKS